MRKLSPKKSERIEMTRKRNQTEVPKQDFDRKRTSWGYEYKKITKYVIIDRIKE